jgi:hypothetical protein
MNASQTRSPIPSGLARPLRAVTLLAAFGSAAACTAILAPHDDVQRCQSADDCDPTGDNRYVPLCTFDDAHMNLDSSKYDRICVADYAVKSCDPMASIGKPFGDTFMDASCTDLSCAAGNEGKLGCALTGDGACLEGARTTLMIGEDEVTFCGEDGVVPGFALSGDLKGQNVKDQYCKSFFCDEDFVCDPTSNKCTLCHPDADFGDGGCGTAYKDGAPAAVYVLGDALEGACKHGKANIDEPVFGAC